MPAFVPRPEVKTRLLSIATETHKSPNTTNMSLSKIAWEGFSFGYGTLALCAMLAVAAVRKPNFIKMSAEDKKELIAGTCLMICCT